MTNNRVKEYEYYPLVKEALEGEFKSKGYYTDFEITGHPRKKNLPSRFLFKNNPLQDYIRVLPTPDVMGLVWIQQYDIKLVIAEFKCSPRFRDIFQTKGYDELFDSDHTFLVSAESVSKSSQSTIAFIRNNPQLLKTKSGISEIYIYFLHKTTEGIITLAQRADEIDVLPSPSTRLFLSN